MTPEQSSFLKLNDWYCILMFCPSQCYYYTKKDETDYVLYLKWRHIDPWSGHILKLTESSIPASLKTLHLGIWSYDIFLKEDIFLRHDDVEIAKNKLIELFKVDKYFEIRENLQELFHKIDDLQKTKNLGRGVTCVQQLCNYLKNGYIDEAISVYKNDGDKICGLYPDLDKMICEGLNIKPRYQNSKWPK